VRVLAIRGAASRPQVSGATVRRMRRLAVDWMDAHGKRYDQVRTDSIVILALPMGQYDLTHTRRWKAEPGFGHGQACLPWPCVDSQRREEREGSR